MKENVEQLLELKDGRTIFKTHNGFKSWLLAKNHVGNAIEVTDEYYNQAKVHAIGSLKTKK